jgi:transposase-like protein
MKNKKTIRAERISQIKAWEKSGLSIIEFCKENDITKDNFYYWRTKYRKEQEAQSDENGSFINISELKGRKNKPETKPENKYEFLFPNGIILKVNGDLNLALLKNMKDA